jgi:L-amino acid N-acyltransferase YncA
MLTIEPLQPADWCEVLRIFAEGLATGVASFETELPTWEHWNAAHLSGARLAARRDGKVAGWAALSPISTRRCYAGVAEVSLYIAAECRGQGLGTALLAALVDEAERLGLWTLQAVLFAENTPSLALHLRGGFRLVGRRERIAQLNGIWHDTLLLERRSDRIGRG